MPVENTELVIFNNSTPVQGRFGRVLDNLPVWGARRINTRNTLQSVIDRIKRDMNEHSFTYEVRLPQLVDDIPPKIEREIPLFLRSGATMYDIRLLIIREAEDIIDLNISDWESRIHLTGGRMPKEDGYIEWKHTDLPKNSLQFMNNLIEAEVDQEKIQQDFVRRQKYLGDPSIHLLYWNREIPGGAFTKVD